jgi:hypothetical protein
MDGTASMRTGTALGERGVSVNAAPAGAAP